MDVRLIAYNIRSQLTFKIIFFQDELIWKLEFSGCKSKFSGLNYNYSLVRLRDRKWKTSHNISVQFSHSVVSNSLWPCGLQHARPPCPSPTPRVYPNPCPLSQWCHSTISSSVIPFSTCLQSFPASGSFQMSQLFVSCGQCIGVSASTSVLPMNIQDWFPLWWTGSVSLQSKGLSRVFSNTTVQKHQFFGSQFSLLSNCHIHTWPLEKP